MNDKDVVQLLAALSKAEGIRGLSRRMGIDHAYVWRVINGQRPITQNILSALGLEAKTEYQRKVLTKKTTRAKMTSR